MEVRNLELELEIGRSGRESEKERWRKEEVITADAKMEVEEKLAAVSLCRNSHSKYPINDSYTTS